MRPRGLFCLSGVGTHDDDVRSKMGVNDLVSVPMELRTMRHSLASLGLEEHLSFTSEERRHDALARDLRMVDAPPDAETLVLYCTGHGVLEDHEFSLLLPDGNFFDPASMIAPLAAEGWRNLQQVVFIIDACHSEPGLDAALFKARTAHSQRAKLGFWGIGASRRLEEAGQGLFASAFAKAVDRSAQPSWSKRHLDPRSIAREVDRALGPEQSVWLADGHPAHQCRALPNPHHQSLSPPRGLPLPADWAARARGVATADLPGFFFVGRTTLVRELRGHLIGQGDDPVVVVTGSPGAGKSALLGHLVVTAHKDGRSSTPGEITLMRPKLPASLAAARGTPTEVTAMLLRELGPHGEQDLVNVLRSAPKPLALILDDLDETTEPEVWSEFFSMLRSIPDVRLVVSLAASSKIPVGDSSRVHDLDDLEEECGQDIREYLRRQVRLAVPGAGEQQIRRAVDALAPRVGTEWAVAVAVGSLSRTPAGDRSIGGFLEQAVKALDAAAHRVCRERVGSLLGEKAKGIVSALSALCAYGDTIALPAVEWAAAASQPGGPRVLVHDVTTAARLMRSLVEYCPAPDGSARWRACFGHPDGGGHPKPETFLQRLPQVTDWRTTDWHAVDSGVQTLTSRAAALGLLPGSLLDDPEFLVEAPPSVVSRALQQQRHAPDYRTARSRMWSLVPHNAPAADRALMLRIGAERFGVAPLVSAFRTSGHTDVGNLPQSCVEIDWVQPDNPRSSRTTHMAATSASRLSAVVTIQDDDSLSFWDPLDGKSLRPTISVPGTPRDVTVAVVQDRAIALVSTWQREIWLMPCHENDPPMALRGLVPPCAPHPGESGGRSRPVPLLLSLHPSGQLVVTTGPTAWAGGLDTGEPLRMLATMDSEILSVRTAGPVSAPVVWLSSASGHIRCLPLRGAPTRTVSPFPVPYRPLALAVSETGDQALVLDASGDLHLRGTGQQSAIRTTTHRSEIRTAALGDSMMVIGGSTGRSGWLEVLNLSSPATPARLPLDEAPVDVALYEGNRLLVARTCGLLSLKLAGRHG
ncbi:ATP-binding protein [Streptomyces sp. MI02-7b]|uniref:ATP-binding protein n=1 Tax=Streptomyces sp. MI02-7b TaxID=462941 RepID=UPI0029AF0DB2|nr:ATP-binding protein [Streptomyces sp. MI02-7b]MDX3071520.1 ATP-binding protein [Streptomyces sp. MI02-7b]